MMMKKLNTYRKYSKIGIGYFINKHFLGLKKPKPKTIILYILLILLVILFSKFVIN